MKKITSDVIVSRLSLARQGAGTIPALADLELIRKNPSAVMLHSILLWMSFQQDAVQEVSLEDIRKNVLGWGRNRFYRAISILEEYGYLERHSTPKGTKLRVFLLNKQDTLTEDTVFPKREHSVLKTGTQYSQNGNTVFSKREHTHTENPVNKQVCEALNNINNINTHTIECELVEEIINKYIELLAARQDVRSMEGFRRSVLQSIAEGRIDMKLLESAAKQVMFPQGVYKVENGYVEWNGNVGLLYGADGVVQQVVEWLPPEAEYIQQATLELKE